MNFLKSLLFSILVLISFSSFAEEVEVDDNSTKLVLEAGIHVGGDRLVTATFSDGSTETIDAGEGLSLAAGAKFTLSDSVEMVTTFGIKTASISASNGSIDWTRFPLNAIFLYKNNNFRVGGGLTYHMSPTLEGDGIASGKDEFDDALGTLLDAQYFFSEKVYFGVRATFIDYQAKTGSATVNGNSVGILIGAVL